jgi:ribosomal protein S18 acetylase RimI-like enzyme
MSTIRSRSLPRQAVSGRRFKYSIRNAYPTEFSLLGELTVDAYASLPGMPSVIKLADYYGQLRDVARRALNPAISVFVAATKAGELLGSVDFIADMKHYGAAGAAGSISDAAGMRFLAVKHGYRGRGIGRSLTTHCVDLARASGKSAVILHTTRAMPAAWAMYEGMGFQRRAEIDFQQGTLEVYGFRLDLAVTGTPFNIAPMIRDFASPGYSH